MLTYPADPSPVRDDVKALLSVRVETYPADPRPTTVDIKGMSIELKYPEDPNPVIVDTTFGKLIYAILLNNDNVLTYSSEPSPVVVEASAACKYDMEIYPADPRPTIDDCKLNELIYPEDPMLITELVRFDAIELI